MATKKGGYSAGKKDKSDAAERAAFQKFKKDIAAGQTGSLYVFHGEEHYLRDYYLEMLEKKLIAPGTESFNRHTLHGSSMEARNLADAVDALPVFSPRTLIVVHDLDLFKGTEDERNLYTKILNDVPEYCCLVLFYDTIEYKVDGRMRKLAGALKEHAQVIRFSTPDQNDLLGWIARHFRAQGHDIARAEAEYLVFLCGSLMNNLLGEIDKIAAYAPGRQITRQDIDAVAIPKVDAVVFNMTDALAEKNNARALAILSDLLRLQEEPIPLLGALGKNIRQRYTACIARDERRDARWLMELWGMRSAYPAEKLMRTAHTRSVDWYRYAMRRCAETDLAMKSQGGVNQEEMLISLVLELAQGVQV